MDPIGLGLEGFDSGGSIRTAENGVTLDTSGELDGMKFTDAAGLAKAVHDDPAAPSCVVNRTFAYGMGRLPARDETDVIASLQKGFQDANYRFPALLRQIATSDAFYRVAPPEQLGLLDTQGNSNSSQKESVQ